MFKSINLSEALIHNAKVRQENQKQYELTHKNIEKCKKIAIKEIKYPEYKEAYDYVDKLFPRVKVKDVTIYKVAATALAKMGYGGAEGFYDPVTHSVIVCGARKQNPPANKRFYIKAKIERDEVIVHELCHYCYVFEGQRSISSEMREEFAYGWSVGYLRQKGFSDEQIVKYNFLPYLTGISYNEATKNIMARNDVSMYKYNNHTKYQRQQFNRRYSGKIFDRAKEIAMERGLKIIELYSDKIEEGSIFIDEEEDVDRFDFLDL